MVALTTQFINIIESVGFPIVAFGMMWKYMTVTIRQNNLIFIQTLKENTKAISDLAIVCAGLKRK